MHFNLSAALIGALAMSATAFATPALSQQTLRLTVAMGHPEVFLWVKHVKQTFIPAVNAELDKYGEVKIEWTEGYGGTIVKLGSEVDAFENGIIDVGQMSGVFNPATLGLLNMSYAMPFGPADAQTVTNAVEKALIGTEGALPSIEDATGIVYIGGGVSIDDYNIGADKAMTTLADMDGVKIAGAGPNLAWLRGTGAVGVQGSFVTFYNDIKAGVYDGYIGWHTAGVPAKLYEVAPHWNEVHLGAMYIGGLGVSKQIWDTFSDKTKAAFRAGAAAYSAAFHAEQAANYEKAVKAFKDNGGQVHPMDPAERAKWIAAMPNPTTDWIKAAEARKEPARGVLKAYTAALKDAGFAYERDYLAE